MRDEDYVIDLCDHVLGSRAERRRCFDFLRGDPNALGKRRMLPVDAHYPDHHLVVEYWERQHEEPVPFFDKPMTVSGIGRAKQRRIYDMRRMTELPVHGLHLIVLRHSDFQCNSRKRLLRLREADLDVIRNKFAAWRSSIAALQTTADPTDRAPASL